MWLCSSLGRLRLQSDFNKFYTMKMKLSGTCDVAKQLLLVSLVVQLGLWSGPFVEGGSIPYAEVDVNLSNFVQPPGCNQSEICVAATECPKEANATVTCELTASENGVCCPFSEAARQKRSINHYHEQMLNQAIREGRQKYAEKVRNIEKHRRVMTANQTAQDRFHALLQPAHPAGSDPGARDLDAAYENLFVTERYAELTNMSMEDRRADRFNRVPRAVQKRCLPPVPCNPHAKYRTIDGTCNNPLPDRTSWGAAEHPFDRVLPPAYEDGVWAPRIHSVTGNLLPNPRVISPAVFPDEFRPDPLFNIAFMQMGQITAHDFTRSPAFTIHGEPIQCCSHDWSRPLTGPERHFACMPIIVPPNDPFYSKFGVRCLNFVRIRISREGKCKYGYAKQVDAVTHFIDASTVYGSDDEIAAELRQFRAGLMKVSFPTGIELLPFNTNRNSPCVPWAKVCYEAGDSRVNQLIGLTQFHTIWVREHNRIARVLAELNPHWDDETLYQESRRIVIAETEHIVYNEFLRLLLGVRSARRFGLLDTAPGYEDLYDPNERPIAFAETAVAAHRYGHSLVEGWFRILHRKAPPETLFIKDWFNDPSKTLEPNSFDDDFYSFQQQPMEQLDHFITTGLTDFLFAERKPFGSDLASININRQRDFAVQPYNEYRVWAGLPRLTDFHQLGEEVGAALASVYESPDDIDLWVGGIVEPPSPEGGILGVTFNKLIAAHYHRLKFGDRYFYTNGPEINPGAFTLPQLEEIKQITFAKVICANVDHKFDFYQAPEAFIRSDSHDNVPVPCTSYRPLDLSLWKE